MKYLLLYSLIIIAFAILPTFTSAHPGGTASDGMHSCWTNCSYWGEVYGQRHSHGGGYSAPSTPQPSTFVWDSNTYDNCGNWWTPYERNAREYFASTEYINDKAVWQSKISGCENFLSSSNYNCSFDTFLAMYEWGSTDIGTILDDVECHGPFKKLPEYIAQEQLSYEKKIEEQTLFYQIKTGWSWLFD